MKKNWKNERKLAGVVDTVDLRDQNGFESAHLFSEMAILNPSLLNKLQTGLQWIKDHNIKGIIIGGAAVVHYVTGARSLTPDVDVLVNDIGEVTRISQREGLTLSPLMDNLGYTVKEFDMDFLDVRAGNQAINKYAMNTAKSVQIGGTSFPMVSPEVLTILKFDIEREKDQNDAFLLLKSGVVKKDAYLMALKALRSALSDYESLKLYAELIK